MREDLVETPSYVWYILRLTARRATISSMGLRVVLPGDRLPQPLRVPRRVVGQLHAHAALAAWW